MPAMLEDPSASVIHRTSGDAPYPTTGGPLPLGITPRQITLRDRVTVATLIPFSSPAQIPVQLLAYLLDQLNREIEKGDTYPMIDPLTLEQFGPYWFGVFGAIMLQGDIQEMDEVAQMANQGHDWEKACLGSFYIKPNYPGRSSHVCNGGFLVTDGARNRGVGRLMGETYLEWAPKLGYAYSVFNLVYETNVASCRIWDALGFKRIGRVKGCGDLRSFPGEYVDAIIYGRDLGADDDFVSEERFDKIRFYLKNQKYPNGADRAEKSRLRSAATHYKLIPPDSDGPERLMLKGKEVISDPQRQYEIARTVHHKSHGGINKTTAAIAEAFHWVRIKETVSQVIRNCPECSEMNKNLANSRTTFNPGFKSLTPRARGQSSQAGPSDTTASSRARRGENREESPSDQLQMEASQSHHPMTFGSMPQYTGYNMPLDPALIHNQHEMSLENLPPSPFLAAGRGLPMPHLQSLDHGMPESPFLPNPAMTHMPSGNSQMSGLDERAPTASQEIRRRLTRAGYSTK